LILRIKPLILPKIEKMKNLLTPLFLVSLASCQYAEKNIVSEKQPEVVINYYGDSISAENAMKPNDFLALMKEKDSTEVKFEATILECCQKKGCWMNVDMGKGVEPLTIRFKDYAFFVPTSGANGKSAIIEGVAYYDTLDVAYLKHMAEDAGKSKAAIDSITEPKLSLAFEAKGVIIKENISVVN
jgi:hypothetical protein